MNDIIINELLERINERGMKLTYIAKKTGIKYQRLMRIFNSGAVISACEVFLTLEALNIPFDSFWTLTKAKYSEKIQINLFERD